MPFVLQKYGLKILNNQIRQNSALTKLLFGVKLNGKFRIHWDFTTLLLKKCLVEYINKESKVLEIGTGPYAILSIYLKKKINCQIDSCDINKGYMDNALITAKENRADISIYRSDLFDNVNGKYDVIFFNSVYIPEEKGIELGINKLHDYKTDWCGGNEGISTISNFFAECCLYLNEGGKVFLGFNPKYCEFDKIKNLSSGYGLSMFLYYRKRFNPSGILILSKK